MKIGQEIHEIIFFEVDQFFQFLRNLRFLWKIWNLENGSSSGPKNLDFSHFHENEVIWKVSVKSLQLLCRSGVS